MLLIVHNVHSYRRRVPCIHYGFSFALRDVSKLGICSAVLFTTCVVTSTFIMWFICLFNSFASDLYYTNTMSSVLAYFICFVLAILYCNENNSHFRRGFSDIKPWTACVITWLCTDSSLQDCYIVLMITSNHPTHSNTGAITVAGSSCTHSFPHNDPMHGFGDECVQYYSPPQSCARV